MAFEPIAIDRIMRGIVHKWDGDPGHDRGGHDRASDDDGLNPGRSRSRSRTRRSRGIGVRHRRPLTSTT